MIPEKFNDLLSDEKQALMFLGVTLADGSPHVTPVWFKYDGEYIIINSARGRVKDRAMRARPYVAATISDPDDIYNWVQIRGPIVEITEENAFDMICELSLKYRGTRNFTKKEGEVRVTYKIKPEKVTPSA